MEPDVVFQVRWQGLDADQVIRVETGWKNREQYWPMMASGLTTMVRENGFNIADLQLNDIILLKADGLVQIKREGRISNEIT